MSITAAAPILGAGGAPPAAPPAVILQAVNGLGVENARFDSHAAPNLSEGVVWYPDLGH